MELQINGQAVQFDADPAMPLLWVLRDLLNMTGTKFGCGVADCGACTVQIDGQAVRSCVAPVGTTVGKRIQTIEALGTPENRMCYSVPGLPSRCRSAAIANPAC